MQIYTVMFMLIVQTTILLSASASETDTTGMPYIPKNKNLPKGTISSKTKVVRGCHGSKRWTVLGSTINLKWQIQKMRNKTYPTELLKNRIMPKWISLTNI